MGRQADAQLVLAMDPLPVAGRPSRGRRREAPPRADAAHRPAPAAATQPGTAADLVGHAHGDRLLVTVPEVARLLHIGRRQAWEMVWRGELPVVRLGRSVRVARPVLERFVTERSLPYGA